MLAFSIFITHSLNCYVAYDIIWNQKLKNKVSSESVVGVYVTRLSIVLLTCK